MAAKPEAIVIIIDVSQSMAVASEGEKTPLEKCITAANMIVQRKIFSDMKKNKDEAALILFGTNGTENSLNGANGGYEHVTLAQPLGIMDLALLKFINEQITAGDALGDFIDAVVVALDHLHTKCLGRKMEQKIILFSNVHCEFGEDQLDTIIGGMKANDVNFIFVGPEVDDDDNDKPRPGPSSRTDQGRASGKQLTQQQIIGLKCIRHILDEVDGEGMSLSEVLPLLSFFETRRRKQVPAFRGAIEIGANLKINATAFVKTSEERPSPWHKLSALAESAATRDTMDVVRETTYFLNDEDQTEVEQENTAQAYRYGKTLVPMTKDDQKSMKLETTRGCVVLGFTSRDNIDRHLFSRNGCHIFVPQPEDEHATVAFSALCHALAEKEMVAIVRYVSRSGNDPKIGFLAPHIKHSYESLIFVALPYREDLRQYFFPSLEGEGIFPPSEEQLAAVDGLIDTMSLVRTEVIDGENIHEELYKPRNILNPVNQRECQCIQSRALNPEENRIPEIEEYIQRSITVVPEIATNCRMSSETVKAKFKLEVNEQKKAVKNVFRREKQEEKDESDSKKSKINDDDNEANEFSLASLNRNQVTEVGTVDPVNDFKRLVQNANLENFAKIGMQMSDRILRLVLDSFIDQYYAKAIQCLTVLKEECLKRKQSCVFNKLLLSIKDAAYRKRRHDFWELIAKEQITPISKDNDPESDYTCDQSKQFYEDEIEERADKLVDAVIEDENELLDMM